MGYVSYRDAIPTARAEATVAGMRGFPGTGNHGVEDAACIMGQTIFVDGGRTLFADFRQPWSSE